MNEELEKQLESVICHQPTVIGPYHLSSVTCHPSPVIGPQSPVSHLLSPLNSSHILSLINIFKLSNFKYFIISINYYICAHIKILK